MEILLVNQGTLSPTVNCNNPVLHSHSFWQLDCYSNFSGKRELLTEQGNRYFRDGELILIPPFKKHTFIHPEACDCWSLKFKTSNKHFSRIPLRVFPHKQYHHIAEEIQKSLIMTSDIDKALLVHALHLLLYRIVKDLAINTSTDSAPFDPRLREAMNAIINGLLRNLNLDQLVKNAGMSKSHFIKLFRDEMGTTPMKYVNQLKSKRASELLAYSHLTITEIALQLNYPDIHSFSRSFKKHTGLSPKEYRKHAQTKEL